MVTLDEINKTHTKLCKYVEKVQPNDHYQST
jgi:hypothetical protein